MVAEKYPRLALRDRVAGALLRVHNLHGGYSSFRNSCRRNSHIRYSNCTIQYRLYHKGSLASTEPYC